jgi:arsenic resistance protein ArsH
VNQFAWNYQSLQLPTYHLPASIKVTFSGAPTRAPAAESIKELTVSANQTHRLRDGELILFRRSDMGAEVRVFDPLDLPQPDAAPDTHPKVKELRDLAAWSEGMVWCSPERHGAMTGILKSQIDWIPLSLGAIRPTQGKTLAVMEVCGGSQSFNAVNQMRILGRWMRMLTIPNQSSVAKAFLEFEEDGRMKPSAYYDRMVDVMEELVKFTLLTRDVSPYLVDRYSERKESVEELSKRVNQKAI